MFRDTPVYKRLEKIISFDEGEIFKITLDNDQIKELIIRLQTEVQMGEKHEDSEGNTLFNILTGRSTYSLFDPKGRGGQLYELNDTGEFWESTRVVVERDQIVITMNPIKDGDNLFEIYGAQIEGLTQESIEILAVEALRAHIAYVRREIT